MSCILSCFVTVVLMSHESVASAPADFADAAGGVRFASPLQSLTIWDHEHTTDGARSQFLSKYKAGLQAEAETRKEITSKRKDYFPTGGGGSNWAEKAAQAEMERKKQEDRLLEEAFDKGTASVSMESGSEASEKDNNEYQFVGVVNKASDTKPITWYARKKPAGSNWSMRLVHVNRDAIIKDLFNRGKVDVFARYSNTGKVDEESGQRIVQSKYEVRERSWRNLWNFSPKHFFTDSSGMYWRERRLRPGLYTDGAGVYETTYRYGDGRNGMRQVTGLDAFLNSKAVDQSTKDKIQIRLKEDDPDVVLEE